MSVNKKAVVVLSGSAVIVSVVVSALPVTNAMAAQPAQASARTPIAISIGDSFISGEGGRFAGNVYSSRQSDGALDNGPHNHGWKVYRTQTGSVAPDNSDLQKCHRSDSAEINVAAKAFGWTPVNLACSGAVTNDVLGDGYRGEKSQVSQLNDYAANPKNEIKAVVVSIGGNDLGFSDLLTKATQLKKYHDAKEENLFDSAEARGPQVRAAVTKTLDQITNVMRKNGYADGSYKFVYQSYSNLFAASNNRYKTSSLFDSWYDESPGVPMSNATVDYSRSHMVPWITNLTRQAAKSASNKSIQFMDLTNALAGHELSSKDTKQLVRSASKHRAVRNRTFELPQAHNAEWVVPINSNYAFGSIFGTQRQQESYHPNRFGQEAYGTCLAKTLATDAKVTICTGQPGQAPTQVQVTPAP